MRQYEDGRNITWEFFKGQIDRLSHLPGYERVTAEHVLDWYPDFGAGWFPYELAQAVRWLLRSPSTTFFPNPGKLLGIMQAHRNRIGGRDWDSTYSALLDEKAEMEERFRDRIGQASSQLAIPEA